MKKIIVFILSILFVLALSITAFAEENNNKYFSFTPDDKTTYDDLSNFVYEKGFDGILFDCRGGDYSQYINSLPKNNDGIDHMILIDPQYLNYYVDCLTDNDFFSVIIESSYSDQAENEIINQLKATLGLFISFNENVITSERNYKNIYDVIILENNYSCYSEYGFEEYLTDVKSLFTDSRIIPFCNLGRVLSPVVNGDFYGDAFEISNQFLSCKLNDVDFCVSDYKSLIKNRYNSSDNLYLSINCNTLNECADFTISNKFEITRPTTSTLVVDTYYYTIFGTSDPEKKLYVNGEEVERIGSSGLFAYRAEIPVNGKTFSFYQGSETKSVFITRSSYSTNIGTKKISKLKSCYPTDSTFSHYGDTIVLSCVAPGQSIVTAEIDGQNIELHDTKSTEIGMPTTYSAEFELNENGHPIDEVTLLGKVTYYLTYNGTTTKFESSGNIYCTGENGDIAIRATTNMAGVEQYPTKNGQYVTTLRKGCCDYVLGEENGWYLLSCGGYINSDHSEFVTGNAIIDNSISSVELDDNDKNGKIKLNCSVLPAFCGNIDGYQLKITLYNTTCEKDFSYFNISSSLMYRISFDEDGNGNTVISIFSHYKLWGWDIFTDEESGELTIVIKKCPKLSDNQQKPLSGINITVCAGHGGKDPGALSVAGEKGVNEAQINKANALIIGETLENLGANVQYLICESGKMDTYDRTDPARESLCDVYICCHANSVAENANANKWCGTEIYYHYDSSSAFSSKLCDYISLATGRDNEGSIQDYYSVTRLTICPAVMMEVGFVSNPKEFESLIDQRDIQKTAFAVSKAVLEICDN